GWALTPETAGVAREDNRGPAQGPITAWIRRRETPTTLMIGGRNLSDDGPAAALRVVIGGRVLDEAAVQPGFFLRMLTIPPDVSQGTGDYASMTIQSEASRDADADRVLSSPNVAIEQFDAKPVGDVVFGFGNGWHEQEYN